MKDRNTKSHVSDYTDLPIHRLQELCSFYNNQAQIYFNEMVKSQRQLAFAELILSKNNYSKSKVQTFVDGEPYYDYEKK